MAEIETAKPRVLVMLDERIIALMQEIKNRPKFFQRMLDAEEAATKSTSLIFETEAGAADIGLISNFEDAIGFIAAECNVLLDGTYTYEDICCLCDKLRLILEDKRSVIVNTSSLILPTLMN